MILIGLAIAWGVFLCAYKLTNQLGISLIIGILLGTTSAISWHYDTVVPACIAIGIVAVILIAANIKLWLENHEDK